MLLKKLRIKMAEIIVGWNSSDKTVEVAGRS